VSKTPGGPIASRPLHFIWILDASGSMSGEKIQQLNFAIRESLPEMQKVASSNENAQLLVRSLVFSSGARWHVGSPTPVDQFSWTDVTANGVTDMGQALALVAEQLRMPPMEQRALPPVLVLVSDGQPTDDFDGGLAALDAEPWGQKAVRIAIAIGQDADTGVLQRFMGTRSELVPLLARDAATLVQYVRWASTAVVKSASAPSSGADDGQGGGSTPATPMPTPPPVTPGDPVW
jgi:uncharacterized protein YegL